MVRCGDSGGTTNWGEPCGRPCKAGFNRCNIHGAQFPGAKVKAEQLLAQSRMPASETLYRIIEQYNAQTCLTCGFPVTDAKTTRNVIKTCQLVLDRTGLGPHMTIGVEQSEGAVDLTMMTDDERATMLRCVREMRAIKDAVRVRQSNGHSLYPGASGPVNLGQMH